MKFKNIDNEIQYFKNMKRFSEKNVSENLLSFLICRYGDHLSIKEMMFLEFNSLIERPKCIYNNCDNYLVFGTIQSGYSKGCCKVHSQKLTNLEKYGVENPSQVDAFKIKRDNTMIERFGVKNAFQSEEIKEKIKLQNIDLHGVEYNSQREDSLNKREENNFKKYGHYHTAQIPIIREKTKETIIKKYGVSCVFKSDYFKECLKKHNLETYGVEYFSQTNIFKEKVKKTSLERYDVESPNQCFEVKQKQKNAMLATYGFSSNFSHENRHNIQQTIFKKYGVFNHMHRHLNNFEFWKNRQFIIDNFIDETEHFLVENFCNFFNCSHFPAYELLKTLEIPYKKTRTISKAECEIFELINVEDKIQSDKKILDGFELDILVPSQKLAIEFNGLYWHSEERGKCEKYHLNKTLKCEEKGIQLIHIFENEWVEKQNVVLSIINERLNIFETIISSNQYLVKYASHTETFDFLNDNSIQFKNDTWKGKCLGCFKEESLLFVLTFEVDKQQNLQITNVCSKLNTKVIDGFANILKFIHDEISPKYILATVDRRLSDGKFFKHHNFKKIAETSPKLFNNYSTSLKNFRNKIWDCGELIFELESEVII